MANALNWQAHEAMLALTGDLDRETLLPFWQQREALLAGKTTLDVSGLHRVDSAGLALLVQVYQQPSAPGGMAIVGASERLKTLIALYNLNKIIPVS